MMPRQKAYSERVETICSLIPQGQKFADVGCDHGFCAQYVLNKGLFSTVYISDISRGSLRKAEALLKKYIDLGRCVPVLADGMKGLPNDCDCVLIAGLGGEEIVRILDEGYLPENFVLQPMKNSQKVREFLLERGANITRDFTFGEGYFYDLLLGVNRGGCSYSPLELQFGKENLRSPSLSFFHKIEAECRKIDDYLLRDLGENSRREMTERKSLYEEVLHETQRNLRARR